MIDITRIGILRRPQGYYLRWWYNGWHYWQFYAGGLNISTVGQAYRTYGTRTVSMVSGQLDAVQVLALRTVLNSSEVYILTDSGWRLVKVEAGSVKVSDNKFGGYELQITTSIGSRLVSSTGYSPVEDIPVEPPEPLPSNAIVIVTVIDGVFTIVVTGTAGSTITINWGDGVSPEIEIIVLTGGEQTITHDYTGSGGAATTITISGDLDQITNLDLSNNEITEITLAETLTDLETLDLSDNELTELIIPDTLTSLTDLDISNNQFTELPIIPDTVPLETLNTDGNPFVDAACQQSIGTQVWACKNYDVNYPNSKAYGGDEANVAKYGRLYSFAMIHTEGFCPYGFRLPTLEDWNTLINYAGGAAAAGGNLKAVASVLYDDWFAPSKDEMKAVYDEVCAHGLGSFVFSPVSWYWTSSEVDATTAHAIAMVDGYETNLITKSASNLRIRPVRYYVSTDVKALRDTGQAGGIIFHIVNLGGGNFGYYEVYATELYGRTWSNITAAAVTGTGTAIGTGAANTLAIIAQASHTSSIASVAADLQVGAAGAPPYWADPNTGALDSLGFNARGGGYFFDKYGLYSIWGGVNIFGVLAGADVAMIPANVTYGSNVFNVINGDANVKAGLFIAPAAGTYAFQAMIIPTSGAPVLHLYKNGVDAGLMAWTVAGIMGITSYFDLTLALAAGDTVTFVTNPYSFNYWQLSIISITDTASDIRYQGLQTVGGFWAKRIAETGIDSLKKYYAKMLHNSAAASLQYYDCVDERIGEDDEWRSVRLIRKWQQPVTPVTYNDWYLPSLDELAEIDTVLYRNGIGGLSGSPYWSSSEADATWIECVNMGIGGGVSYQKGATTPKTRAIRAFTSATVYALGAVSPSGGYVFYKNGNDYLEAAPVDQNTGTQIWSDAGATLVGTGTAIGTGQANTTAIISQVGHSTSAAKLCNDYTIVV